MILQILKSNRTINLILFPLFGVLLWLRSFLVPKAYPFFLGENQNILYYPISKITDGYYIIQVATSLLLVIFTAFLIQQVNDRYSFIRARTKLPAAIFVIIIGGFTSMHTLHPVFFAAIFLLLAIHSFFSIFNNPVTFPYIFNTGFFLGVGTLFYFNLFIVVPAFFIGIIILCREFKWREFVILTLGFLVPLIFAFSFAFYTDQFSELVNTYEQNIITPVNHFKSDIALQVFLGLLAIFTAMGSIKMLQQYDSRKISTRKYYTVFLLIFIFTIISFVFIPASSIEMLVISVVPVTFLVSNLFISIESKFWGELLFTLLVVMVVFMQISDKFIQ